MLKHYFIPQLETHLAEFLASVLTLVQASLQTVFILDASCRWAAVEAGGWKRLTSVLRFAGSKGQAEAKPGRQLVTFLVVTNLAMWMLNTLETSRTDAHPTQVSSA